jgi:hypothetical protein
MLETAPKAELLRSLGCLVRGLSALFWGLPIALIACIYIATGEWLRPFHLGPPVLAMGLLYYGLSLLGDFQKQERVWHNALERAKLVALVNVGLSPFIYWWNRIPSVGLFSGAVTLLMITALLFLFNLNQALQRLAAMLPDETLRHETRVFGNLNIALLTTLLLLFTVFFAVRDLEHLPDVVVTFLSFLEIVRHWLLVFFILLPIAMTMTLIWKIKETIFASVFSPDTH